METKLCKKCGRTLPVSEFNKNAKSKDGLHTYCRNCHNDMTRKAYLKRKARNAELKEEQHKYVGTGVGDPRLAEFHPRELIAELQVRGYRGKLYVTREITV